MFIPSFRVESLFCKCNNASLPLSILPDWLWQSDFVCTLPLLSHPLCKCSHGWPTSYPITGSEIFPSPLFSVSLYLSSQSPALVPFQSRSRTSLSPLSLGQLVSINRCSESILAGGQMFAGPLAAETANVDYLFSYCIFFILFVRFLLLIAGMAVLSWWHSGDTVTLVFVSCLSYGLLLFFLWIFFSFIYFVIYFPVVVIKLIIEDQLIR